MGTRGLFGFYYKGKYYVVYNHFDSYPSYLGRNIVKEIKESIKNDSFKEWIEKLLKLKIVYENQQENPTEEDIKKLTNYKNLSVSYKLTSDWYCLLRGCQGSLINVLESGYILLHLDENQTPIWQEYAYIINFDTNKLDFYEGYHLEENYSFDELPDWD
jgi:hypothetical protein